ncbi:hypothetical protein ACIQB5_01810 [Streptomyces sp. NPDC088560]|uniref:hypothetical protein n=1 Tax=Streptomyces sp. NPDC088560 TaxID=3365868 RepID=UPI0037FFE1BA
MPGWTPPWRTPPRSRSSTRASAPLSPSPPTSTSAWPPTRAPHRRSRPWTPSRCSSPPPHASPPVSPAGCCPPSNALRPRLGKPAAKVENLVTRRSSASRDRADTLRSLLDDLQSLDQTVAAQLAEDPENELSDHPAHFGDRSRLDPASATSVRCSCGRPAERYVRRALVPTALDTECVICPRCGDVSFRLPGSPELLIHADDKVTRGGTLQVRVAVRGARPGPVRLGLYVPRYLRADCTVAPALRKIRATPDEDREAEFTLTPAPGTTPQAYYLTAYAVQDLAVTTARRHFGVLPQ